MAATSLPPGFRFHPTDKELVGYYLRRKVDGREIELEVIPVIDLYKFEPWDLPDRSFLPKRDMEWFFFCPRDRKYPNGSRTNRATRSGYWKATGKDRKVTCQPVTALRKTLVFYRGRAPAGDRTGWVMHEYRLCEVISQGITHFVGDFALCHIMKRNEHGQKAGERKRDKTNASEDGPPNSNTTFCRNYGSIPASPPNGNANARGTQIEPVVIDQHQTSPGEAEAVLLDSPKDFPVGGSNGSPLMLQDHEFQASPLAFPFCTPMDFSLATPNMDLCEEAGFMMPFPSPMDYMDMCSNVMNPSFQSMQWEGVETWNLTFSPICRQASEDGIGEPTSLWCLDDSGIVR